MTISQRIFAILDEKKLKQKDLAQYIGISTSAVSAWNKKANTLPSSEHLSTIADFLGVSLDFLLTGHEKESVSSLGMSDDEQKLLSCFTELSPLDQGRVLERAEMLLSASKREGVETHSISIKNSVYKVSAGAGILLGDEEWDSINVPDTKMSRKADFSLTIKGNSMLPVYSDGDIVLVKSQNSVELGEIGIFIVNSAGYIKKLGAEELISINEEYENISLGENDDVRCVGKVLGKA